MVHPGGGPLPGPADRPGGRPAAHGTADERQRGPALGPSLRRGGGHPLGQGAGGPAGPPPGPGERPARGLPGPLHPGPLVRHCAGGGGGVPPGQAGAGILHRPLPRRTHRRPGPPQPGHPLHGPGAPVPGAGDGAGVGGLGGGEPVPGGGPVRQHHRQHGGADLPGQHRHHGGPELRPALLPGLRGGAAALLECDAGPERPALQLRLSAGEQGRPGEEHPVHLHRPLRRPREHVPEPLGGEPHPHDQALRPRPGGDERHRGERPSQLLRLCGHSAAERFSTGPAAAFAGAVHVGPGDGAGGYRPDLPAPLDPYGPGGGGDREGQGGDGDRGLPGGAGAGGHGGPGA